MRRSLSVGLVGLLACGGPTASPVMPAPTAAAASTASPELAPPASGTSFLRVAALPAAPIIVKGYPDVIGTVGREDYATHIGFSRDGELFVYRDTNYRGHHCGIVDRSGALREIQTEERVSDKFGEGRIFLRDIEKKKQIDELVATNEIPKVVVTDEVKAPPLTGTWPYSDITLEVVAVPAKADESAHYLIGGSVAGEAPVHPIRMTTRSELGRANFATLHAFVTSPKGDELALLVRGDLSNDPYHAYSARRMPIGAMASIVYDAAGLRHHGKHEWPAAARLFEKAVAADPSAKAPAYNLARAWARMREPRRRDALAYAISLDAAAKQRAQSDGDFDGVRGESWFPR